MAIPVQHEDMESLAEWGLGLERVTEQCVFCEAGTRYWHLASNNPVCQCCASTHDESELLAQPPVECTKT